MSMEKKKSAVNRRTAVKSLGIAALASGLPALLTSKSRADAMGKDEHRYELVKDWLKLPNGVQTGYTHGVAEDKEGRIYIFNQSKDAMLVCDPDGKVIKTWGDKYQKGAHGLHLSREADGEFLYLSDYELHTVTKTALDGEEVFTLTVPKESGLYNDEAEYKPTNVAVAPNGDIYIGDGYGKSWIHQYNKKGEYIRSWGGPGQERGQLSCPHGLWVDSRGGEPVLVVADRANVRLQMFTLDGHPLAFVSEELRYPCDFDIRGTDLLIPDLHGRVTIFDKDNKLVTHLGDNPDIQKHPKYPNIPHEERIPGKFISPHAARWDRDGNIYVVEWVSDGRVTKLKKVS